MYLDVRPAIDDSDAVVDRTKMFFKDAFPGIYRAMRNVGVSSPVGSGSGGGGVDSGGNGNGNGTTYGSGMSARTTATGNAKGSS